MQLSSIFVLLKTFSNIIDVIYEDLSTFFSVALFTVVSLLSTDLVDPFQWILSWKQDLRLMDRIPLEPYIEVHIYIYNMISHIQA